MTFYVYSRQGCHLCEVLIDALLPILRGRGGLEIRDIDSRADWRDKYGLRVPVLVFRNEEICEYRLTSRAERRLGRLLAEYPLE